MLLVNCAWCPNQNIYRYTQISSFAHPTCLRLSIWHHWCNFIEAASFWYSGRARCCYRETFCWICVYYTSTYVYKGQNIKATFYCYPLVSLLSTGLHWYRRSEDLIYLSNVEDLFRIRFAAPFVINDITINVMKPSCLTSGLEEKVCLIGNHTLSDSFRCVFSWYLFIHKLLYVGLIKQGLHGEIPFRANYVVNSLSCRTDSGLYVFI